MDFLVRGLLAVGFLMGVSGEDSLGRVFTSVEGKQLEAEVVEVGDLEVELRREGEAQGFTVPVSRFCPDDRRYLESWRRFRSADAHPLGWRTFRIHTEGARALISVEGFHEAVTGLRNGEFQLTLPIGAWISVEYELNDTRFRDPRFLVRYDGSPAWRLHYEEGFLFRSDGDGKNLRIVGAVLPSRDSERFLRRRARQMPEGLALNCSDAQLKRISEFGLIPGSIYIRSRVDDPDVLRQADLQSVRALRMTSEIDSLERLNDCCPMLEYLDVEQETLLEGLGHLAGNGALRTLCLNARVRGAELADLAGVAGLEQLQLGSRIRMEAGDSVFLSRLGRLQSLLLSTSSEIDPEVLRSLPDLTSYSGPGTEFAAGGEDLLSLRKLTSLYLPVGIEPEGIAALDREGCLRTVRHVRTYRELPFFRMPEIRALEFYWRGFTGDFSSWNGMNPLQNLRLTGIDQPGLEAVVRQPWARDLERLEIAESMVSDFRCLGELRELKFLEITRPEGAIEELNVSGFEGLDSLRLEDLPQLRRITGWEGLSHLRHFTIQGAAQLEAIEASPSTDSRLEELRISDCPRLVNLGAFRNCRSIRFFIATDCPSLSTLNQITEFNPATYVYVRDCGVRDLRVP